MRTRYPNPDRPWRPVLLLKREAQQQLGLQGKEGERLGQQRKLTSAEEGKKLSHLLQGTLE